MNLDQFLDSYVNSTRNDWNTIDCWGHGAGSSYKDKFIFHEVYDGSDNILWHTEQGNVSAYKPNLEITIAWGMNTAPEDQGIDQDWATNNPDSSPARVDQLDFFFNNALVYRISYAVVDGGRGFLPIPGVNEEGNNIVSQFKYDIIRKLNDIAGKNDFDRYFRSSGMEINDNE
jgi:hypothetical protein